MNIFILNIVFSFLLPSLSNGELTNLKKNDFEREIPPMNVPETIAYWGYQLEEHFVTTPDGYVLGIHRIPGRKDEVGETGPKPVVYLGHGMTASSAQWVFGPPENSLGYVLADKGYDVWMANIRGNTYSKNHTHLDTCSTCPEFWSFGFNEGATIDYPTVIDYILETTGEESLFFVGHSMGTTQYLILLSERPEYNSKIKAGFLLAPAVFMTHSTSAFYLISQFADELQDLYHWFGYYEFLPHPEILSTLAHLYCDIEEHPDYTEICANIAFLLLGFNLEQLNRTMIPVYMDHLPASTSTRPFVHYAQLHNSNDQFVNYDYGSAEENQVHYGRDHPPVYDLAQVVAKTAIYVGDSDTTSTILDSEHVRDVLPNVIHYEVVDLPGCTHLDFALGIDAREKIYNPIIQLMAEVQAEIDSKK